MAENASPREGHPLTELSNAMVALHREHFGRGPGAAKTIVTGDMVVCTLSEIFTQVEKTLIRAGEGDHVRETRDLHQSALEAEYRSEVERITGRLVVAFLSVVHIDPDVAVEIFLFGSPP